MKLGIVVSEFNGEISSKLLSECLKGFKEQKIKPLVFKVPGAVEIPLAIQDLIFKKNPDAVVALGVVLKGETDHYRAVCEMCSRGIIDLMLKHHVPIVFEVLMADSGEKARARIKKGYEAAFIAVKMAKLIGKSS